MSVAMIPSKIKSIGRKEKKKKDKMVKQPAGTAEPSISGPKAAVNDGLYKKLAIHQSTIMEQIEVITNSLESDLGEQKVDLSSVVTIILRQLDSAVSTTQQCLTKEVYERNINLKPALGNSERRMYADVAFLVKWADFRSRHEHFALDKDLIYKCVDGFKVALNDIVRLVAQSVMVINQGHPLPHQTSAESTPVSVPNRQRRASLTEGLLNRVVATDDASLPNASLPAGYIGAGAGDVSVPGIPTRARSVNPKHLMVNRESLTSDSSTSGDSDLSPSRRGISVERHETPDAEFPRDRSRTDTDLVDNHTHTHPYPYHHHHHYSQTSPPPNNIKFFTPPPQGRGGVYDSSAASSETAARRQSFPAGVYNQQKSSSPPAVNGLGPGVDSTDTDQPPPIPPKMRKRAQMGNDPLPPSSLAAYSMSSADPSASPQRRSHYDTIPAPLGLPPVPPKKKNQAAMGHASSPPPPLPQHSPQHSAVMDRGAGAAPPIPLRLHSIPWLAPMIQNATGPAKPPRNDTELESQTLSSDSRNQELIHRIDQYNRSIKKAANSGEKPPLPVKKKTVLIYNQLMHMQNYTFDESIIPSMPIPDMTAPPPVPPKRRPTKKPPAVRHDSKTAVSIANGSPRHTSGIVSKYPGSGSQDDLDLSSEELDEKVNYLEVEDVTPYLTFNKEEEGLYTLRGGPIDALIAYAASTSSAVKQYTEAFLLTFYTIISPDELVKKLIQRLHFFYKEGNSAVWQATTSLLVRLIHNLHSTLSRDAEFSLSDMIHTMLTDGNLKFGQLIRDSLIAKLNQVKPSQDSTIPIGRALSSSTPRTSLLDLNSDQIAMQMSILDAEFFSKVDVSEMLYWAKQQNEEKCPQLTSFTMHFNNVSQWCKTRILERDLEFRRREKIVLHFIAVMKALRELSNFNSYLAILSAIESAPVSRLDWSERVLKGLEEPRQLIDCTGSFKNYRQAFAQTKPPCIPYIGLYLKDLTALEEQPSKLEDGVSINFSKRWKQFKSVDHIRFAQSRQYSFPPDPSILSVFNNFDIFLTDDELWSLSHEIKPSGRRTATQAN